jgi:F-type H+-transporting ATPase subunit b
VFCLASGGEAAAGHHEEGGIPFDKIGWQAANLGILLIATVFLIRSSVKELFANRRKGFLEQSEKTKSALKGAEAALSEIKNKLSLLESGEKSSIEKAGHEAADLKNNVIKDSEHQAEKLKSDSQLVIKNEIEKVKSEISTLILGGAILATTKKITDKGAQITKDSESEFLKQLGQVKA